MSDNVEKNKIDLTKSFVETQSKPHSCPVCYGKGIVSAGFYLSPNYTWISSCNLPETCRTCGGKGIVWG